jgi:hypothetical protein
MAPSIAAVARKEEGNALAERLPGLIGSVQKRGQPDGKLLAGEWLMPLVMRAVDRVMSRKEGALLCGLSEPEFSKQLSGAEGKSLNVRKLGALGERFTIAFADEIRAEFKLDDPAARIERAAELVTRGLAMLVGEVKR